ncbi:MAG: flagellar hook-associated protein FlgL [Pirellulales bacterium]|nr:flagellar hook-associated protein FlgL [Pirellulales bacterium]
MAGIIPLPSTRISGALVRQRLLAQLQSDQLDLFRLQNQVSTGQRITLASEDAPAARRAMTLQRLLERKDQLRTSVDTGQYYLQATDVALDGVATLLGDIRGLAIGAAGTTSTESIRNQAASEIDSALKELLRTANTQFRGRYLFSGSQTNVKPYSINGTQVEYHGDDRELSSYSDLGVLFGTNAAGVDVFGGVSGEVLGGVDLNPQLAENTPLSTLLGGRGISANGALRISDGTNSTVVDVSRAVTVGDVLRMIEANPPAGRSVSASINGGVTLQLDAPGGGNLTVTEVGSGKTASELGILEATGVSTSPLVGADLNPVILRTSRIDDLLGTKARARLVSAGTDNDLLITAAANGPLYNGVTVQMVDDELLRSDAGIAQGQEYAQYDATARAARTALKFTGAGNDLTLTATTAGVAFNDVDVVIQSASGLGNSATAAYNPGTKRLTITVDDAGATTVDEVVNAVNGAGVFTAAHDPSAEGAGTYNGAALIDVADVGIVRGDTGNSGGAAKTLYVYVAAGQSNANNVAAAINAQGTFTAELDTLDASTASQAGNQVVSLGSTATTTGGTGTSLDVASGLRVVNGGETHSIDLSSAETVEDVLNLLNGADAGLHADINADATGINIRSRFSGSDFQIGENGGQTATQLGVRTFTGATRLEDLNHGVGVPTKRDSFQQSPPAFNPDFTIIANDGAGPVNLVIDASSAETVQDVLDLINNHASNNTGGIAVVAQLNATGNGIQLVDTNARPLTVTAAEGSQAAEYLGLLPAGSTTATDPAGVITGVDRNYRETSSVFTTLVRLKEAIQANDINAMNRAIEDIDADIERVTFARADVGARQRSLTITQHNLEDEDVQLRGALSEEIEVDIIEAISNLTARQVSLEASLKTTANILQMSLLNFL